MITQHSNVMTQTFFRFLLPLLSILALYLLCTPCFAQGVLANPFWRLPSLPNLPSGERTYDAGGASPDQPGELDSVSRPIDVQGELKTDTDGVKANKYRIGYSGNRKRIQGKIESGKRPGQEDLEASELPGQTLRLPDMRKFGFQYQPPSLGRIGFDALLRKPNEQTQE
jgi:hypothetical protein